MGFNLDEINKDPKFQMALNQSDSAMKIRRLRDDDDNNLSILIIKL